MFNRLGTVKGAATSTMPDSDEEEVRTGPILEYAGVLKAGTMTKRKSSDKLNLVAEKKKKSLEERLGECLCSIRHSSYD